MQSSSLRRETRNLSGTPAPTKSWQATLSSKGGFPADAQIAVSSTHVIVSNRQQLRYYDKNGVAQGAAVSSNSFFSALNLKDAAGNPIDRYNDVRLLFDEYRKRFWVTTFSYYSGAANVTASKRRYYLTFAVSKTQNPADGWFLYYTDCPSLQGVANSVWKAGDTCDYPVIGIDPKLFTMTIGIADSAGAFKYWKVVFFPADPFASGQFQKGWEFWDLKQPDGGVPGLIAPAVHHGYPSGGRTYWVSRQGSDQLVVWALTNPLSAQQKVQATAVKMPLAWANPVNGQQKGSTKLIKFTNLGTSPMKAVFRSERLHTVTNDAWDWGSVGKPQTSIRYVRLPVSSFPNVSAPPNNGAVSRTFGGGNPSEEITGLKHYGWAAVEANKYGDAIIGYARTGEKVYPEVRGSVYMANENDIRASRLVKLGDQAADNPNYPNATDILPWGDTSGASVDPSDDTGIWIAQEYASSTANNNGNYDIWVAKFFGG